MYIDIYYGYKNIKIVNEEQNYLSLVALSMSFWLKNGRRLLVTVPFLVAFSKNYCALRNDVKEVDRIIRVKASIIEVFITCICTTKNLSCNGKQ